MSDIEAALKEHFKNGGTQKQVDAIVREILFNQPRIKTRFRVADRSSSFKSRSRLIKIALFWATAVYFTLVAETSP